MLGVRHNLYVNGCVSIGKGQKNFLKQGYSENNRLYTRRVTVGIMNWKIIPLLTFACDQKTIFEFEREWVLATGASLNKYPPVTDNKYKAGWHTNNKKTKRYYCKVCNMSFIHNQNQKPISTV